MPGTSELSLNFSYAESPETQAALQREVRHLNATYQRIYAIASLARKLNGDAAFVAAMPEPTAAFLEMHVAVERFVQFNKD
jgi:hypothetical protein